ncbi:hypothetical protein KAT51_04785 [bacterium]|nr:hypothetical protein [bacterium]
MEEQRFGLEKEQLESLKEYRTKKPDWYLQAEELVKSGQAPGLGLAIKMVKKIKTPEEELDFYEKQLKLQKKYALQKEGVTPEEKQLASTFGKHANLVGFATGRLKQHKKDLLAKTKKNSRLRPPLPPGVLTPEQELANINKLLEEMAKITSTSMASGRPLMPEYLEAIQRVNKAKSGDLKSGRLYEEIKARWASGLQRYEIGQKKQDAQGQWWEYIGNDKWRLTRQ